MTSRCSPLWKVGYDIGYLHGREAAAADLVAGNPHNPTCVDVPSAPPALCVEFVAARADGFRAGYTDGYTDMVRGAS